MTRIPRPHTAASALEQFVASVPRDGGHAALTRLSNRLDEEPLTTWIACAPDVVRLCDPSSARAWLLHGLSRWPAATELRYRLAHVLWQDNEVEASERILLDLLAVEPDHADAVHLLANIWRSQGKLNAAATALHGWCMRSSGGVEVTLRCAQFIAQCQQQSLALDLCDREIERGTRDAGVLALSANLALQLGKFELARTRALSALDNGVALNQWFIAQTLAYAQRYRSADHPDFKLFARHVRDPALSPKASAAIHFALGKAHDNIGDYARAAQNFRAAHELARPPTPWSRAIWDRLIDAKISALRNNCTLPPLEDAVPVFIIGLPRTGTTLVAELLGRDLQVRNRGELSFMPFIAQELATSGRGDEPSVLREAAKVYLAQLRQDDAPVRYYLDKNPLNFRHLELIATLFPNARIIHCDRDRRDTALSIWSQFFAHNDYGFAHAFADIAAFAAGHDRLMQWWRETLSLPIFPLHYEALVRQPELALEKLRSFLGIVAPNETGRARTAAAVTTASVWQARQAVYTSSLHRWRAYAEFIPELVDCFPSQNVT
jgi:tetratricopeptide (TPR) repeat protein